ncbi:MAG: glycosyltransferase [Balneola sp.]|nr:MAG: glycosyltransferase [Balneola sp.]
MGKLVQLSSVHHSKDTRIFYKICKSLVNHGFEVDLIIQHHKSEKKNGINIVALPIATRKLDRLTKIIPRIIYKSFQYDKGTIFHFHDPELIPVGLLLKMFGYKVIYDVHEDVPKTILEKEWIPFFLRKTISLLVGFIEKIGNRAFDATIVVTNSIRNRFSHQTILIQNYPIVKPENKSLEVEKRQREDVFYVGSISFVRGIREIVKAIELLNRDRSIQLVLAGTFINSEVEKQVKSMEGWKYVKFLGHIDREELKRIAESCLAGLVIFHPIPNHIEAQPNKIFEYMGYELPVIGSNFKLWEEIVVQNDCGILVNPLDPNEIAKAVERIYNDPIEGDRMGKRGKNAVLRKYIWENEEKKLIQLYNQLLID